MNFFARFKMKFEICHYKLKNSYLVAEGGTKWNFFCSDRAVQINKRNRNIYYCDRFINFKRYERMEVVVSGDNSNDCGLSSTELGNKMEK